jgi:hypothetical protein
MSEQRLLESLENSGGLPGHLKYILYYLVQDVDLQIGNHLWFIHVGGPHIFFLQFGNS